MIAIVTIHDLHIKSPWHTTSHNNSQASKIILKEQPRGVSA